MSQVRTRKRAQTCVTRTFAVTAFAVPCKHVATTAAFCSRDYISTADARDTIVSAILNVPGGAFQPAGNESGDR
jgi:hypothetical protein